MSVHKIHEKDEQMPGLPGLDSSSSKPFEFERGPEITGNHWKFEFERGQFEFERGPKIAAFSKRYKNPLDDREGFFWKARDSLPSMSLNFFEYRK